LVTANCAHYYEHLNQTEGVTTILIHGQPVQTYCTEDGWTVIQSRGQFGNPKDFFSTKLWRDYVAGFGTPGNVTLSPAI
jgi:hypothetical protein